ncbi:MAG: glycosyltransferase [Methylococcales bacterium]|nr:glycosyltransferase [Methylococcales bacterium]
MAKTQIVEGIHFKTPQKYYMIPKNEHDIMASWSDKKPLVSIICATFNHEGYIKEAINGFLLQETTFPFEIIIHEDVSTDNTATIVQSYVESYPHLIKPIFQKENQYSKGASPFLNALAHAQGDYIAICEGDDFWTDPSKLQSQADYLSCHPEFSMAAHAVNIIDNTVAKQIYSPFAPVLKSVHYFDDILREHFIPTLSLMIRKSAIPSPIPAFFFQITGRDIALELLTASQGPCYYDTKKRATYRHHDNGITKTPIHPLKQHDLRYTLYLGLLDYLGKAYEKPIRNKLAWVDLAAATALLREYKTLDGKLFLSALLKDPWVVFRILFRKFQRWAAQRQPKASN